LHFNWEILKFTAIGCLSFCRRSTAFSVSQCSDEQKESGRTVTTAQHDKRFLHHYNFNLFRTKQAPQIALHKETAAMMVPSSKGSSQKTIFLFFSMC
jgi:hypothetical protein